MKKMQQNKHKNTAQGQFSCVYLVLGMVLFLALMLVSPVSATVYILGIKVDSNPTGASGYLDNVYLGMTPIDTTKSYSSFGYHHLQLKKDGYCTQGWQLYLAPSNAVVSTQQNYLLGIEKLIQTGKGRLNVRSTPRGADFYLDGKYLGKTPVTNAYIYTDTIAGVPHTLSLKKTGYVDYQETVTVSNCYNTYRDIVLQGGSSSLSVVLPNGGETWQRGTSHIVTWSYSGSPGLYVKIVLLKAGVEIGTIAASAPIGSGGLGSYTWNINPSSSSVGSDYKVKISSTSQPTITDTSNNYFTLTPAGTTCSITVTSPNGGETWKRGTSHTVTWSYSGSCGSYVKIMLLKAGVEVGTIKDSTSIGNGGLGSYTWNINPTGATGSNYQVKVVSLSQPTHYDTSNNYFTLTL